jgi:hypothetical protein
VAARIRSIAAGEASSFSSTSAETGGRGCELVEVLDGEGEAEGFFIERGHRGDVMIGIGTFLLNREEVISPGHP